MSRAELLRLARSLGWQLTRTSRGHWLARHPDLPEPVVLGGNRVSWRTARKEAAQIKRAARREVRP